MAGGTLIGEDSIPIHTADIILSHPPLSSLLCYASIQPGSSIAVLGALEEVRENGAFITVAGLKTTPASVRAGSGRQVGIVPRCRGRG